MAIIFSSPASGASATVLLSLTGYSPIIMAVPTPALGAIYTTPVKKKATIASIEIFNNSGVAATIQLCLNIGGGDFPFKGAVMANLDTLVDTLSRALPAGGIFKASSDQPNVSITIQVNEVDQ